MSDPTPRQWTRTHTIWLLFVLSLSPGLVAAAFRDGWEQLPAGVRGASIIVSAILIVAGVSLILARDGTRRSPDQTPDA